jgi:hypothetical protein
MGGDSSEEGLFPILGSKILYINKINSEICLTQKENVRGKNGG